MQESTVNFDKFIDDELLRRRRTVDVTDNPYRALERKTRRMPSEVKVVR